MSFLNRVSRDYQRVPGVGGSLQLQAYDSLGNLQDQKVFFELDDWVLNNLYINQVNTHSGSNGAVLRDRVGADWNFSAFTSQPVATFLDLLVGHWRSVAVIMNLGDPVWWESLGLEPKSYRAAKGILERVRIVTSAKADSVVKGEIQISGNSLLVGYLGEVPISANVWP